MEVLDIKAGRSCSLVIATATTSQRFQPVQAELVSVASGCCGRYKMKAIVPLFTATLFVVCSAFPLYEKSARGQQSNNFCATLAYPQRNPAAYVHLCHTPGQGITHTRYTCCVYLILFADLVLVWFACSLIVIYPFFSTTIAGTCITANLPRCLLSTMQNPTPMTVTVSDREHEVLFSATSCEPGKQLELA